MSQYFGSASKKWQNESCFQSPNRKVYHQKPYSQSYSKQRKFHNDNSHDHWHRPDYRKYESDYSQNFAAGSSASRGGRGGGRGRRGGRGGAPGVGIFITPCYTDFGNTARSWNTSYGYDGFQNSELDVSGGISTCRRASSNMKGDFISANRNGPSSHTWSPVDSRSTDQVKQNVSLWNGSISFDSRAECNRTNYSNSGPADQKVIEGGEGSKVGSSLELASFKTSLSSSAGKAAGREVSRQEQSRETGNNSVVHGESENKCNSNSKARNSSSVAKRANSDLQKVVLPSKSSKIAGDKSTIKPLIKRSKKLPEGKVTTTTLAAKIIGSKSPRMRQLTNVAPDLRKRVDLSSSSKERTATQEAKVSSSSRLQKSSNGAPQTTQVDESSKQKIVSVLSSNGTAGDAVQGSKQDCRSASAGARPKLDIVVRKKRSNGLSKEDLMKLISSPRSRHEHLQLNRILQAHAEKQKNSMLLAATLETEEHEDVESSCDHSELLKEIEVSNLPVEIQREIDMLCQGATNIYGSVQSDDVSVIDLSDLENENISASVNSASKNAVSVSNANANCFESRQKQPQSEPVCGVSVPISQSQGSSSETCGRALRPGCPASGEEIPGTAVVPSVSQPNVDYSLSGSAGGTSSPDDQSALPHTEGSITSSTSAVDSLVPLCSTRFTPMQQTPTTPSNDCQRIVNESRSNQGGAQSLENLLQISLREEEIRGLLKETESMITNLEEQLKQLKEQLSIKLTLKQELTEEKVHLRTLRLQILTDSVSHQQEASTIAVTPVTERLANVPYQSSTDESPSGIGYHPPDQNIPPADSSFGFDSVMRSGIINIEPVNDDYDIDLDYDETVCPLYENNGTVQLITIAPTEGGDFSDEDERTHGHSTGCENAAAAMLSCTPMQTPKPSVGLENHDTARRVVPGPGDPDDGASMHMEYVGTLSTSNLQPEVLQQIALSMQPLDAPCVPFRSPYVTSSSVHEFSCSEDETVEPSGPDDRILQLNGNNKISVEPNRANKKKTVELKAERPSQPVLKELDDCVISRVERLGARMQSECEQTSASVKTAPSETAPSQGGSVSGRSPRAAARAQKLTSTSHPISTSGETSSSNAVGNLTETPRSDSGTVEPLPTPRPSSANRLQTTFSTGGGLGPSSEQKSDRGRGEATAAKEKSRVKASKRLSNDGPVERKRKGVISSEEPPSKRRKSLENPDRKKKEKTKRMAISIFPRAYPGVLYRHGESARSIVLGDEVVITASDDGQIVRHPLPRQVYGLAEKKTFTGHQRGVIGLIAAKVQVSRDISRTVALSIGKDQLLKMHCIQTGKVLMTYKFDKSVCYDCICEANDTVYIGMEDGSIARLSTSSFVIKEPFTFPGSSRISALATFADDMRWFLLVGFGDCTISVRDTSDNSVVQTLQGHVRPPRFILRLKDRIASSSGDCCIFIHRIKESVPSFFARSCDTLVNTLNLLSPVVAMTTQPKHELLVVACRNRTVTCIDIKEQLRYIIRLSTIEYPLTCLAASHQMVYFGCNNGMVYHINVDMTRHWSCGFSGCKDWFLLKGDLEDHIREDHCGSNQSVFYKGQYRYICGWHGCKIDISAKKSKKALAHYLTHITNLEAETTPRSSAVTN